MSDPASSSTPGESDAGGELIRKGIHVALGLFAGVLRWVAPWQAMVATAGALLFNLLLVHRLTGGRLLRAEERPAGFSWGVVSYPAMVLLLIVVFRDRLELAAAVWGLLAFGDGMAGVAGTVLGGPRLAWNPRKRWSGWLAFVVWGTAASSLLIRWTQQGVLDGSGQTHIGRSFLSATGVSGTDRDAVHLLVGCLVAAVVGAIVESLDTSLDDNVTVTVAGGATLYLAAMIEPGRIVADAGPWLSSLAPAVLVNVVAGVIARGARSASTGGAIAGVTLGTALYVFAGWRSWLLLLLLVALGTLATRTGGKRKTRLGIAEASAGGRRAGQAVANTGAAVIFAGLGAGDVGDLTLLRVAMVAALATAVNDTVASECGKALGGATVRAWPPGRVSPGTPGGVSVPGTAAGIGAAVVLAAAALLCGLVGPAGALAVVSGATMGSLAESIVGGIWISRRTADHDLLNFANTVVGACCAVGIYRVI